MPIRQNRDGLPYDSNCVRGRPLRPQLLQPVLAAYTRHLSGWGLCALGLCAIALCLLLSGCGYVVGSPFRDDVRTVHVPIFENDSYRRGIELQLTEAVQKRIQDRTPYRLAKADYADTILTGRILSVDKRVENQTRFDDPRELELSLVVEVRWEDRRTGQVLAERRIPLEKQSSEVIAQSSFAPETGQSLATATKDVTDQLAQQIVNLLETPW